MWFLTDSLIVSNMKRFVAILLLVVITCVIQTSEPVKSEAAQQLMQLLNQVNGHQTLSATMACVNWNISEAQWVHQHTAVTSDVNSTAFRQTQHGNANISWWNEAFSHDYVLTRDDVKAMLTSGISAPATDTHQKCRKGIYTLSGSRVQSPRRGIYIIDGKKVIKNHPASC